MDSPNRLVYTATRPTPQLASSSSSARACARELFQIGMRWCRPFPNPVVRGCTTRATPMFEYRSIGWSLSGCCAWIHISNCVWRKRSQLMLLTASCAAVKLQLQVTYWIERRILSWIPVSCKTCIKFNIYMWRLHGLCMWAVALLHNIRFQCG